jgi:hypothetical protein
LSLSLREDKALRIFGPKGDEMVGGRRNCHNEQLLNVYPSPNIIRMNTSRRTRMAGYVASTGTKHVYRILMGNPEGMRLLGRSRRRWEDNIKTDITEILFEGMDWINLAQEIDQW